MQAAELTSEEEKVVGASVTDASAADFVERFGEWWARPNPATLGSLLAPEVVLTQPVLPRTVGLEAAQRSFERLLAALPDLRGTVHRWAGDGETVFIEFTLSATLGGRPLAWENVDRFTLGADGRAVERVNHHDSLALVARMASRPAGWGTLLRLGLLRRS